MSTPARAGTPLDLRLAPGAIGTWAACLVAVKTSLAPAFFAAVATAGLVCLGWPRRAPRHRPHWRGWASLAAALGCAVTLAAGAVAWAQVTHRAHAAEAAVDFADPSGRIHLRLTSEVKRGAAGLGAHGLLTHLTTGEEEIAVRVPAYLIGADSAWRVGQRVVVSGNLAAGEEQRLFLRVSDVHRAAPPTGAFRLVDQLREGLRSVSTHVPPHARGLVPGVAIGDDRRLPEHIAAAMRTTSLTHVTAVSGAHVAVVVATVLVLLARTPTWVRAALASLVLAAMVLVVLPTPSVLRAAGMGLLTLAALAAGRPRLAVPVLFFTVTALLAYDPWLATSIGFALSVAATLGIMLWAGPISQFLGSSLLSRAVSVPLAAQAWCSPLLLTFEATLATYSVPANLLAVPALAPATILGLVSALLSTVAPSVATLAASLASYFTGWIAAVALFFAGLPGAKVAWPAGSPGVAALIALTLGAAAWLRRVGRRRTWQA